MDAAIGPAAGGGDLISGAWVTSSPDVARVPPAGRAAWAWRQGEGAWLVIRRRRIFPPRAKHRELVLQLVAVERRLVRLRLRGSPPCFGAYGWSGAGIFCCEGDGIANVGWQIWFTNTSTCPERGLVDIAMLMTSPRRVATASTRTRSRPRPASPARLPTFSPTRYRKRVALTEGVAATRRRGRRT
jgi:hypothetical protein